MLPINLIITFATFISEFFVDRIEPIKNGNGGTVTLVDSNDIANHNEVVEEINSSWQKHQQQHFCLQPFLAKSPPKPYPTRNSPDGCQIMVQPLNYTPIDETRINATQNLTIPLCFFDKQITLEIARDKNSEKIMKLRKKFQCKCTLPNIYCNDDFYICCGDEAKYFYRRKDLEANSTWDWEDRSSYPLVTKNGIIYTLFFHKGLYVIRKAESLFTKEQRREHGNFHSFISPLC